MKNVTADVNFGQEAAWAKAPVGFTPLSKASSADTLAGPTPNGGGEVVMLVGLPASGKTYWSERVLDSEPEMHWNVLGTNQLLERMKVSKLRKNSNYHGRWEVLIKEASNVFNKLLEKAPHCPRNYILDQTNVYVGF